MLNIPPPAASPRGFAAPTRSPRLTPRDVVSAARTEAAGGQRKGRPPQMVTATRTALNYEARAYLARATSDAPPRPDGFGGKTSADGSQLVDVFQGTVVPKNLELTPEELEQREIAKVVNSSEEASLGCLSGILKQTEAAMSKAETAMEAEAEKAKAAVAEMDERGPESFRPGIRAGRGRRKKKSSNARRGAGGNEDDADSDDGDGDDDDDEGDDEEGAGLGKSKHWRNLPPPVFQGSAEYFPRAEPDEEADIATFDEYGELVVPVAPALDLGPTADRMYRIVNADAAEASEVVGPPSISPAEIVTLMSRARFFREAELQEDFLPVVADWFEVQCYDAGRVLAVEGTWCHSLVFLYSGTLEACGRVYRPMGANPPRGAGLMGALSKPAKEGGRRLSKENDAVENAEGEGDDGEGGEAAHALPQPQLVGTYDTLAPVLLHPGSYFGEAAMAGAPGDARLPHTCTVRTLERCVLLSLRRSTLLNELGSLPVTARQAWEQQTLRELKLFEHVAARWRHHSLRRLRIFKGIEPKPFHILERLVEYRVLPEHTCLLKLGERVTHLYIVLDGQMCEYGPPAAPGGESGAKLSALFALADDIGDDDGLAPSSPPKLTSGYYEGHDVTHYRPGLRHVGGGAPPRGPSPAPSDFSAAGASSSVGGALSSGAPAAYQPTASAVDGPPLPPDAELPVPIRTISDASDVPLAGEAPLLLSSAHEAASAPPSTTIVLTLTQCQVIAIPYELLAKQANVVLELRKRVADARVAPSALMTLLAPPAPKKGAAKLAAAGSAIASAVGMGKGLAGIAAAAAGTAPKQAAAALNVVAAKQKENAKEARRLEEEKAAKEALLAAQTAETPSHGLLGLAEAGGPPAVAVS